MGSGMSISVEAQAGMAKKQAALLASFALYFAGTFKSALVNQCKADAEEAGEDELNTRKLPTAEKPSFPLYEGMVEKSAPSSFLSYKKRFMSVGNAGNNYAVVYKEKQDSPEAKGTINCKALNCERFDSVEREASPYGVKLIPCHKWDDNARTWYFRCENKDDEDGFYDALREACWRAGPPLDPSQPVLAEAFSGALKKLADSENVYIRFDDYTIEESLAKFIFYVMDRDFLAAEFNKIETPMGKEAAVKAMKSASYMLINTAVKLAWAVANKAAQATVQSVTGAVSKQMAPLIEAEAKLLTQVSEITEATVGEALMQLTSKIFATPMKRLALPIGTAMAETIKGMDAYMKKQVLSEVTKCAGNANKLHALQAKVDRACVYYYSGPLAGACSRAAEIPTLIQDSFEGLSNMTVYEVQYMVRDACKQLYRNAVAKFFNMARSGSTDHAASLAIVMGEMIHDAPEVVFDLYFEIFGECLSTNAAYRSAIADPMTAAVAPVADSIAAIPVVGDLVDLDGTKDKCLETFLQSTMSPSIAECVESKYLNQDDLIKITGATPCH